MIWYSSSLYAQFGAEDSEFEEIIARGMRMRYHVLSLGPHEAGRVYRLMLTTFCTSRCSVKQIGLLAWVTRKFHAQTWPKVM
jgi:hypothetical protein